MITPQSNRQAAGPKRILHDRSACTGCGQCELYCSLYHEGEQGPALSRCEIDGDRLDLEFKLYVCRQCISPHCYEACPLKDTALCIDRTTGVTYIDAQACDGCGLCIQACPFTPSRIKMHPRNQVAFKCDLCRSREEGPVCVEFCNFNALKVAGPKETGGDE
jgi:Fe-S-cluster-containing hydrogenase component 2